MWELLVEEAKSLYRLSNARNSSTKEFHSHISEHKNPKMLLAEIHFKEFM